MKLFILFALCLLGNGLMAQTKINDCSKLHEGNFLIKDPQNGNLLIERKKKHQIEIGDNGNVVLKIKIKWTDDCHYQLIGMKVIKAPNKKEYQKQVKNSPTIFVEITEVTAQYHKIRCTLEGQKEPLFFTIWNR